MEDKLPKCYYKSYGYDRQYLDYRKQVWEQYANKRVKVVPAKYGYNSFKELEKYDGRIGTVNRMDFTANGHAAHIYITGCPFALSECFLEIQNA